MYLIGFDIGSSSIKAALVEVDTQKTVAVVSYPDREMDMISRQSGWAEQQPEIWWQDFCYASRKLLLKSNVKADEISAIGLSYQMHGLVLVDRDHHTLRPSIIWCDSRAVALGDQAFQDLGSKYCLNSCLNSPGNFTASKMKWVIDNEPIVADQTHKMMLPGDFIAMKLTGSINTTISGLSEGILWDFKKRNIATEVTDYFGIKEEWLPEIVPNFCEQGRLTKEAAEMTGLKEGTPLTYRAGDQPNNALSLNVLNPGEIAGTSGTSGVVYGIVNKPVIDDRSRINSFAHVNYEDNYDRIGVLLCINGAGMLYSWLKQQVSRGGRDYNDMERMAAAVPIGADGLSILPFGNGAERILDNKNIKSHFFNLQFNRHNRGHIYRAALEGVAFSFVYGVQLLKELGLNVDVMRVGNDNMFQSEIFSKTISTLLDCQIEVVDTTGAVGAAKASGVGAGLYANIQEALSEVSPIQVHDPEYNQSLCYQAYSFWESQLENQRSDTLSRRIGQVHNYEDELDAKSKELASAQLKLISKNEFLKEIKEELAGVSNQGLSKSKINRLIDKIEKQSNSEIEWQIFEDQFTLMNSDFLQKLKNQSPNISNEEVRMCALIKLGFSTKEIASKMNLSVRGIETKRYRLRKKLSIEGEESLEKYLINLS